jgi:hypothetical protein
MIVPWLNILEYLTMKFGLWTQYGAQNSSPVFAAFREGAAKLGYTCVDNTNDNDIDVIWSVLFHGRMAGNRAIWERARNKEKPVIVLEVGGIQRGKTWKVGLNGVNRDAYFGEKDNDGTRANLLGLKLKPWRSGEHILICGQHEKSLQWQDMPRMSHWVMETIETLQKYSNRPILFRPHPRCRLEAIEHQYQNVFRDNPRHIEGTYDDYNLSFMNAHAVISYSSNPGIQSVITGVPAFVSQSSLAYDAANDIDFLHDIEEPLRPERQQWLNDYAWTEFTLDEISSGMPLKRLTLSL